MTFLNKLGQMFLKTFFSGMLFINAIYILLEKKTLHTEDYMLLTLFTMFIVALPFRKVKEVFGGRSWPKIKEILVALLVLVLSLLILIATIIVIGFMTAAFAGAGGNDIFVSILKFLGGYGLLRAFGIIVFIVVCSGFANFFYKKDAKPPVITIYRRWEHVFSVMFMVLAAVVVLNSPVFALTGKVTTVVLLILGLWQEKKSNPFYTLKDAPLPDEEDDPALGNA
ncbi:hypothetical protein Dip518_000902 [Parelusimicrobium proximum]|uniref:hypothetical protein n=1 Tax=Parelusimicrobium proximum TaxID=3228953 RepID=UPI003D179482